MLQNHNLATNEYKYVYLTESMYNTKAATNFDITYEDYTCVDRMRKKFSDPQLAEWANEFQQLYLSMWSPLLDGIINKLGVKIGLGDSKHIDKEMKSILKNLNDITLKKVRDDLFTGCTIFPNEDPKFKIAFAEGQKNHFVGYLGLHETLLKAELSNNIIILRPHEILTSVFKTNIVGRSQDVRGVVHIHLLDALLSHPVTCGLLGSIHSSYDHSSVGRWMDRRHRYIFASPTA